jgi:hypothetical protein
MPKENRAAKSINAVKSRRFSLVALSEYLLEQHGLDYSTSHLSRISYGNRDASPELEKALVMAARALK